jgi:hypothetical protein
MEKFQEIGDIGNYYGGLAVKITDGKYYWGIIGTRSLKLYTKL